PLVVQQVMIERWDEVEVGDALGRDQFERARNVETRQADEGAADQRHGQQRAHAHRVVERHGAERALVRRVEILREVGKRGGAFRAVAAYRNNLASEGHFYSSALPCLSAVL